MRKVLLSIFLITLSFIVFPVKGGALDETAEELKLYLGEAKIISVSRPTRIAIGNPDIADVTNVTKSEITINPKAVGTTTLVFWDSFGEQSYKVKVFVESMDEIKRRVDNLLRSLNLPDVYTKAAEEEGRVILLGKVKDPQDRERIKVVLGALLKEKTTDLIEVKEQELAVEIDVHILELNKDATSTLGLTWPSSISLIEKNSPGITGGTKFSTLFKILNLQRGTASGASPFAFKLDTLIQEGKARILSRPRLACQSGKEAELLVGGEKPIMTTNVVSSVSGGSTNVEYKEYGIKLKIKPTVTEERRIKLGLNVEVSDVGEAEVLGDAASPSARAYPLSKRNASTELFLNDGQTMAIGGLIKQKTEEDLRKFPWLADIPVLGLFFRQRITKTGKGFGSRDDVELFITLTPQIMRETQEVTEVKKNTTASSPVSSETLSDPLAGYAKVIQRRILEHLTYPSSAKEAGFQGTVKLSLRLSYAGELLEAQVKSSSGYKILDDNAISVAKAVTAYPPFPTSIEQKELWIEVPIVYQLD